MNPGMFFLLQGFGPTGTAVPPEPGTVFSPAQVLRRHLVEALHVTMPTTPPGVWPGYVSAMPAVVAGQVPANAVALYDQDGFRDGRLMEGGVVTHPAVAFRFRGTSYDVVFAKATAVKDYLDTIRNVEVDMGEVTYELKNVSRRGDLIDIGYDVDAAGRNRLMTLNTVLTIVKLP